MVKNEKLVVLMGFIVSAGSIFLGGILGGIFKKKVDIRDFSALSIGIMLISLIGLLENILVVSDGKIVGKHTIVVSIALILGFFIGNALKLEDRIYRLSKGQNLTKNGFVDTILFFAIGGLQLSGPILYALEGDSFQLILKGVIDFPFALVFGATYGKRISLTSLVISLMQLVIAGIAFAFGGFLGSDLISQICSLGYLILFFSGFNLICPPDKKIKNTNFLPGLLLIIIYNVIVEVIF